MQRYKRSLDQSLRQQSPDRKQTFFCAACLSQMNSIMSKLLSAFPLREYESFFEYGLTETQLFTSMASCRPDSCSLTSIRTSIYKVCTPSLSTKHVRCARIGISHDIQSNTDVGLYGHSTRLSIRKSMICDWTITSVNHMLLVFQSRGVDTICLPIEMHSYLPVVESVLEGRSHAVHYPALRHVYVVSRDEHMEHTSINTNITHVVHEGGVVDVAAALKNESPNQQVGFLHSDAICIRASLMINMIDLQGTNKWIDPRDVGRSTLTLHLNDDVYKDASCWTVLMV